MSNKSNVIKLDELYRIETDSYNYHLKYEKEGEINEKTGNPTVSSDEWHFSRLSHALSKYLNESLKPAKDIKDLYTKVIEVEKKISNL